jgi:hypothetical protein
MAPPCTSPAPVRIPEWNQICGGSRHQQAGYKGASTGAQRGQRGTSCLMRNQAGMLPSVCVMSTCPRWVPRQVHLQYPEAAGSHPGLQPSVMIQDHHTGALARGQASALVPQAVRAEVLQDGWQV